MALIDEKTKTPLSLVLVIVGIVATGGVVWGQTVSRVSALEAKSAVQEEKTSKQELKQKETEVIQKNMLEVLQEIKSDVKDIKRQGK